MAHSILNYCDNCRRLSDFLYIDEITGLELCAECLFEIEIESGDDDDYEYDDDD